VKVLVLLGGNSPEREVSLRSGKAIYEACVANNYETSLYDPSDGKEGLKKAVKSVDIVLPILHGVNGEDGVIQQQLEDLGAVYLGANSSASKVCFDKEKTHQLLEDAGIRMPKHDVISLDDVRTHQLFKNPFVLKPSRSGSSIDTLIVHSVTEASLVNSEILLNKYDHMLLEELITGQEITVPVLGGRALPIIAIIPPVNDDFSYENKYNGRTQEIVPVPTDLVLEEIQLQAQELAIDIHGILGARHLSRIDMFVTNEGELVVLELNTMPGMSSQSLMPKAAAVVGLDMPKFVQELVEIAKGE
jgi:D-alanine-D-alanine ligase